MYRPLVDRSDDLKKLHVGIGGRVGSRDPQFVLYDTPPLSTPGGYQFWDEQLHERSGRQDPHPARRPAGRALAEAYVPFERWDIKAEGLYINENRRETTETDRVTTLRTGKMYGFSGYLQLSMWPLGQPRISGNPAGYDGSPRRAFGPRRASRVRAAARAARRADAPRRPHGNKHSGTASEVGPSTNIHVNAVQLGLGHRATKHIRLSA